MRTCDCVPTYTRAPNTPTPLVEFKTLHALALSLLLSVVQTTSIDICSCKIYFIYKSDSSEHSRVYFTFVLHIVQFLVIFFTYLCPAFKCTLYRVRDFAERLTHTHTHTRNDIPLNSQS